MKPSNLNSIRVLALILSASVAACQNKPIEQSDTEHKKPVILSIKSVTRFKKVAEKNYGKINSYDLNENEACVINAGRTVHLQKAPIVSASDSAHIKVILAKGEKPGLCTFTIGYFYGPHVYGEKEWPKIRSILTKETTSDHRAVDSECCNFPLKKEPSNYCDDGRAFGAYRDGGRLHAACDLLTPAGTTIYAMADGVVIQSPYAFYLGTDALEIKHPEFVNGNGEVLKNAVVRYGEIAPWSARNKSTGKLFQAGDRIKRGQEIAKVGVLLGYDAFMLHFELYKGSQVGQLTTDWGEYQRRNDLLNPTSLLKRWLARLP